MRKLPDPFSGELQGVKSSLFCSPGKILYPMAPQCEANGQVCEHTVARSRLNLGGFPEKEKGPGGGG